MPFSLPPLSQLLPVTLSSLWYLLGYVAGLAAFAWMAQRRGVITPKIWLLVYLAVLGGLIGANLTQTLFGGVAGKTILGGVAGGWLFTAFAKPLLKIRYPTGDLFAVGLAAGEAVGRWGCYFGGCCYGVVADNRLPWAIYQHDSLRHPTQIYTSVAALLIFCFLVTVEVRRLLPENGIFYLQGMLFAFSRFVIEFYRDGSHNYAGLSLAQLVCVIGFVVFGLLFVRLIRRTRREKGSVVDGEIAVVLN